MDNYLIKVREISDLKDQEIEAFRKIHQIKVRGKGCPRPIKEFAQCGMPDLLAMKLKKKGITKPFPIQMQTIPALMAGRNVIGVASTGSGKTLAYIIPMIRHIRAQPVLKIGKKLIIDL